MKLRNKKTGGVWEIPKMRHPTCQEDDISFFAYGRYEGQLFSYKSLAELNEEWEDYVPKEPLIKDEKIRKVVRAWAKVNGIVGLTYDADENCLEDIFRNEIHFNQALGLEDAKTYTTAELCGEEEE